MPWYMWIIFPVAGLGAIAVFVQGAYALHRMCVWLDKQNGK